MNLYYVEDIIMAYKVSVFENFKNALVTLILILLAYYLINIGNKFVEKNKRICIRNKKLVNIIFVFLLFSIIYFLIKKFDILSEVINIIFVSVIFTFFLNPFVKFIEKKGTTRFWSVLIVYIIIFSFFLMISFILIPKITREFRSLAEALPNYINILYKDIENSWLKYFKKLDSLPPKLRGIKEEINKNVLGLENAIVNSIRTLTDSMVDIFTKAVNIVTVPIVTFYILKDEDLFKEKIYRMVPEKYEDDVSRLFHEMDKVFNEFIRGRLIVGAFVGIATTIVLLILKVDFALLIGIFSGLMDIIPYFGPVLGIIPGVVFAFLQKPIKALWVIILFIVIQQIENNIISPKVVGESVGIHPITVILVLIIGGSMFGILGMLLAVPFAAIFKIVLLFVVEKVDESKGYIDKQ